MVDSNSKLFLILAYGTNNDYEIPIGENFKLNAKKKLGSGAFGDIYFGTNVRLGEDVAIKLVSTIN